MYVTLRDFTIGFTGVLVLFILSEVDIGGAQELDRTRGVKGSVGLFAGDCGFIVEQTLCSDITYIGQW